MSLRIWLPLTAKHSQQSGISDYKANWLADADATDGKIGRCAKFTNVKDTHIPISEWNYPENSISFGAWFKFNKDEIAAIVNTKTFTSINTDCLSVLLGRNNYGGFGIRWGTNNIYSSGEFSSINIQVLLRSTQGSAPQYATNRYTIDFDKWVHIFTVLDRETGKFSLYLDGILQHSVNFDVTKITPELMSDKIGTFLINDAAIPSGNGNPIKVPFKINDLRIYDEALSPKQIKEIAKGLVAHYKFDDPYIEGTTNLVPANIYNYTSVPGAYYSGIRGKTIFNGFKCFSITTVASSSHCDGFICQQTGNCTNGDTYTYSGYAWIPSGYTWVFGERQITGEGAYAQIALSGNSQWQYFSKTFTANDNTSGMIEGHEYEDYSTAHTIYIRDLQLEKKDHATPFAKGTRLSSSWITDASSYYHVLQPKTGVATLSADTPRYTLSTANNGDYFYCNGFYTSGDTTFSCWFKPTNLASTSQYIYHLGYGTDFQHAVYIQSTFVALRCGASTTSTNYSFINNTWYHIASVVSGTTSRCYINGVLVSTATASDTASKKLLTICDRSASSTAGSNGGYRFQGQLSDLRFYCTALTEEDIKELYQTGAILDNKNNMLAYEFIEE